MSSQDKPSAQTQMKLSLKPAIDHGLAGTVKVLNHAFSGYVVQIEFSIDSLLETVRYDGIDFASSRLVMRNGEAIGAALIARRGWTSRLAAMAIIPAARGRGVGTWFMNELIAEVENRGEHRMVLEVIEENPVAVTLYRNCGFHVVRRLVSFAASGPVDGKDRELAEVDIRHVAKRVTRYGLPDLPWQISGETLAQLGPPHRAYRLEDAYVVLSNPEAPQVRIRAVIVAPDSRGQGQATRLLRALMVKHTGKKWVVPAICPQEVGRLFEEAGFAAEPLTQFQMMMEW